MTWYAKVQFNERRQTARRNFVLKFIHGHCQINDSGEYETEFFARGKSVCREAWLLAYNINKETFRKIHHKFKDGVFLDIATKERTQLCPRQQIALLGSNFLLLQLLTTNLTKDVFTCHPALAEVISTKRC